MPETLNQLSSNNLAGTFWTAVAMSLLLPHLPFGRTILFPFSLLGTWVHELGHGLAAIMLGGRFRRLEIYSNLGGVAKSSGVGRLGRAFVSMGGLLGPALAGGLVIILSSSQTTADKVLLAIAVAVLGSVVLVVRNQFGFLSMAVIGAGLLILALIAPPTLSVFAAQFIGIQFCLASLSTLDYMFTKHFYRDGQLIPSDTQMISEALILPYWLWGSIVALASFVILAGSFYLAWIRPMSLIGSLNP